jgi:hypothetical protein
MAPTPAPTYSPYKPEWGDGTLCKNKQKNFKCGNNCIHEHYKSVCWDNVSNEVMICLNKKINNQPMPGVQDTYWYPINKKYATKPECISGHKPSNCYIKQQLKDNKSLLNLPDGFISTCSSAQK